MKQYRCLECGLSTWEYRICADCCPNCGARAYENLIEIGDDDHDD